MRAVGEDTAPHSGLISRGCVCAGSYTPINTYALLENAYNHSHHGGATGAHHKAIAELFAGFSQVAVRSNGMVM